MVTRREKSGYIGEYKICSVGNEMYLVLGYRRVYGVFVDVVKKCGKMSSAY